MDYTGKKITTFDLRKRTRFKKNVKKQTITIGDLFGTEIALLILILKYA